MFSEDYTAAAKAASAKTALLRKNPGGYFMLSMLAGMEQDFEGTVLAVDNGRKNVAGNFTVSRESYGVRVEKLFPFNSPWIQAIKVVKSTPSWRSKLYTERTFCSHKAVRKLVKK